MASAVDAMSLETMRYSRTAMWLHRIIVLILLHFAGAAKHHFQGHRHLIGRMGPWLYRPR